MNQFSKIAKIQNQYRKINCIFTHQQGSIQKEIKSAIHNSIKNKTKKILRNKFY